MVIKKGDNGEKVKQIQTALQITADGVFGNMTEQSVKKFPYLISQTPPE